MAFEKGNPTNYKIKAIYLMQVGKSYKFNCDGDFIYIPISQCSYIKEFKELEIPEWLYNEKFPNG